MKNKPNFFFWIPAAACLIFYSSCRPDAQIHFRRLLCLGDSLTQSEYGSYPRHLKRLIKEKFPGVIVRQAARPGNNSGEYLAFLHRSRILEREKPHLVILMIGTNDARIDGDHTKTPQFCRNLEKIVELIRKSGHREGTPILFLSTIPPLFHSDIPTMNVESARRIREEINPAIREIAASHHLILVDIERFFYAIPHLLPGVHPIPEGYRRLADEFMRILRPILEKKL